MRGSRRTARRAAIAAAVGIGLSAAAAGCAGGGGARGQAPLRDRPAAYALPQPDPGCRQTVRAPLRALALDQVTVAVTVRRDGSARVVRFVSPDLSPAQQLELRAACEACAWRPSVGADGQPVEHEVTVVFGARE